MGDLAAVGGVDVDGDGVEEGGQDELVPAPRRLQQLLLPSTAPASPQGFAGSSEEIQVKLRTSGALFVPHMPHNSLPSVIS